MGVPAFFRWLSKKYPSICVDVDPAVAVEYTFDNLYLDMNGIIHPCTHPEYKKPPETEEEMFEAIFEYIDKLMKIMKPKKLLYMAVDGVAPRAKMNQQRSRRFRASKESITKKIEINKIREELKEKGVIFDEEETKKAHFDSNVITPGTQFMINLSIALQAWINKKLDHSLNDEESNALWHKDLLVVLSDASAPGEGEHKIMEYIRRQRSQENYDPNLSHCLCGADADLIMLGLATHELNFTIIREEFVPNQPRPCEICGQYGHEMKECEGKPRDPLDTEVPACPSEPGFIFIRLNVLREYLEQECGNLDLERFIDDFVFLCFFVGNDFLPHLPSLEIREGAIDRLVRIYKDINAKFPEKNVYLTENGIVNLRRCQLILQQLGQAEDDIFQRRANNDARFRKRIKEKNKELARAKEAEKRRQDAQSGYLWLTPQALTGSAQVTDNMSSIKAFRAMLVEDGADKSATEQSPTDKNVRKRPHPAEESPKNSSEDEPDDDIQLGTEGWKDRYYFHKFDAPTPDGISRIISREYVLGLCWVLLYYYQGCPDWQWFYPFHYAPFASDFVDIDKMEIKFNRKSRPFKPLEQLMSVFPAASSSNLPPSWRKLMTDPESKIIDFYPDNFKIDLNGKMQEWQGVALLPFIDESRLHSALADVYPNLTQSEEARNSLGPHLFFVSRHKEDAFKYLDQLFETKVDSLAISPILFNGMFGDLRLSSKYSALHKSSRCVEFYDPTYPDDHIFLAVKLPNAKPPPKALPAEGSEGGKHRPMIGMSHLNQRASLSDSGHRFVNHHAQNYQRGGGGNQRGGHHGNHGNQGYQGGQGNHVNPGHHGGYSGQGGSGGYGLPSVAGYGGPTSGYGGGYNNPYPQRGGHRGGYGSGYGGGQGGRGGYSGQSGQGGQGGLGGQGGWSGHDPYQTRNPNQDRGWRTHRNQ